MMELTSASLQALSPLVIGESSRAIYKPGSLSVPSCYIPSNLDEKSSSHVDNELCPTDGNYVCRPTGTTPNMY
jgi:hypothetical protein